MRPPVLLRALPKVHRCTGDLFVGANDLLTPFGKTFSPGNGALNILDGGEAKAGGALSIGAAAGADYTDARIRLLLALCRELQAVAGAHPFFLATRTGGRLLDVDEKAIWRWLFLLEQDGWLVNGSFPAHR